MDDVTKDLQSLMFGFFLSFLVITVILRNYINRDKYLKMRYLFSINASFYSVSRKKVKLCSNGCASSLQSWL